MSEPTTSDIFYIKVKDKTMFAIYDLQLSDDCDTMTYGYNFVEESSIDKKHYDKEVNMIVKEQVEKALQFAVADAEKELNT
jgi:hypothetical protein|tara:strand:+ start:413 stop:655 length:243 start_codon:yes stop_codon:yes gene_type:complete